MTDQLQKRYSDIAKWINCYDVQESLPFKGIRSNRADKIKLFHHRSKPESETVLLGGSNASGLLVNHGYTPTYSCPGFTMGEISQCPPLWDQISNGDFKQLVFQVGTNNVIRNPKDSFCCFQRNAILDLQQLLSRARQALQGGIISKKCFI